MNFWDTAVLNFFFTSPLQQSNSAILTDIYKDFLPLEKVYYHY